MNTVPYKRRSRPLLLGEEVDTKVQLYLKKDQEGGRGVSAIAALQYDKTKLVEFGGHIELNRNWTHELMKNIFVLMIISLCHLYHKNIVSYTCMYVKSDTIHQRRVWGQT